MPDIRRKSSAEDTSGVRLASKTAERQMRPSGEYWRAFERWKANRATAPRSAMARASRDEAHERG